MAAINDNPNIDGTIIQIVNVGGGSSILEFVDSLSSPSVTELDGVLSSWSCPPAETDADGVMIVDGDAESASENTLWSSEKIVEYVTAQIDAVSAGDPNNVLGKTFDTSFAHSSSSAGDVWLRLESTDWGTSSDVVPFIVPWDCKLISVTYVNAERHADCDVEIWKSDFGADPHPHRTRVYDFGIRNERAAVRTNFGGDITFARGDKIAVYLADRGQNSDHPVVQLMFLITDNTASNVEDDFRHNFSGSDDDDDDDDD